MISVGVVVGGPECDFFLSQLRALMSHCADNEASSSEVNIVYHLPGSVIKPEYEGLRTAKFSRKERTLMIQIAVDEKMISSSDQAQVRQYIRQTAESALVLAKKDFELKGLAYDLEADREFLARWPS